MGEERSMEAVVVFVTVHSCTQMTVKVLNELHQPQEYEASDDFRRH
jgi:hypothetical protein